MYTSRAIGILGGVGPHAGLDLMRKVLDATTARTDQEHLPLLHFCYPGEIAGRPSFLEGHSHVNPGEAIGEIMVEMAKAGACVLGIACNTAHSPAILDVALSRLAAWQEKTGVEVHFVHMISESARYVASRLPEVRKVGLLGSAAVGRSGVFQRAFEPWGVEVLIPEAPVQAMVDAAILDEVYGIKAVSNPVSARATSNLDTAARELVRGGAEAILLGCTELPLALTGPRLHCVPLIDVTVVLARALITAFAPHKLKPESVS